MPPNKTVLFLLVRVEWLLVPLVLFAVTSCTTTSIQQELLSDYYWEVQQLRMRAGSDTENAEALRDLGIIYLRTGHYREATGVLSQALDLEKSDPKIWFYMGLSREMLADEKGAISVYSQAPTLSNTSLYSRAMKGRIEWLQSKTFQYSPDGPVGQEPLQFANNISENVLIVYPFECKGRGVEYTDLGKGLSLLIGRNLEQLRGIELANYSLVQEAKKQTFGDLDDSIADTSYAVARLLGAGKVIEGTCNIDTNDRISVSIYLRDIVENESIAVNAEEFLQNIPALERAIMNRLIEGFRVWIPNSERRMPLNQVNLETLLVFSEGLASEDKGEFSQSIDYYNQALTLNPRFILAEVRLGAVNNKILAQGTSPDELKNLIVYLESITPTQDLLDSRLQHLGRAMSSGYIPGEDTRKLPPGNVGELPAPPRPDGN